MKAVLIMSETPIIVANEEIRINDWFYNFTIDKESYLDKKYVTAINQCVSIDVISDYDIIFNVGSPNRDETFWNVESSKDECKKIIAGIDGLSNIMWNGFDFNSDISKIEDLIENITEWSSFKDHPIGKQASQALDIIKSIKHNVFDSDDVQKAINIARKYEGLINDEIIDVIKQPKQYLVEVIEVNGNIKIIDNYDK